MPIRQRDNKWYWGSKGPFTSRKKAEKVAQAAHASGYVSKLFDFTKQVSFPTPITGGGSSGKPKPLGTDVPEEFRQYLAGKEAPKGTKVLTGARGKLFIDTRTLEGKAPEEEAPPVSPEVQQRAEKFDKLNAKLDAEFKEEEKAFPKKAAEWQKNSENIGKPFPDKLRPGFYGLNKAKHPVNSKIGKDLETAFYDLNRGTEKQKKNIMDTAYGSMSEVISDAFLALDEDKQRGGSDVDYITRAIHGEDTDRKPYTIEEVEDFVQDVMRAARYTTRELPDTVTLYRGASRETQEYHRGGGILVPTSTMKDIAQKFATRWGKSGGRLHTVKVNRAEIVADITAMGGGGEGEHLIPVSVYNKNKKTEELKVEDTKDFANWSPEAKREAKMDSNSPYYDEQYAAKERLHEVAGQSNGNLSKSVIELTDFIEKAPFGFKFPSSGGSDKPPTGDKSPAGDKALPTPEEQQLLDVPIQYRIYLETGEKPPEGIDAQQGPQGGMFYDSRQLDSGDEDQKATLDEHTQKRFDDAREQFDDDYEDIDIEAVAKEIEDLEGKINDSWSKILDDEELKKLDDQIFEDEELEDKIKELSDITKYKKLEDFDNASDYIKDRQRIEAEKARLINERKEKYLNIREKKDIRRDELIKQNPELTRNYEKKEKLVNDFLDKQYELFEKGQPMAQAMMDGLGGGITVEGIHIPLKKDIVFVDKETFQKSWKGAFEVRSMADMKKTVHARLSDVDNTTGSYSPHNNNMILNPKIFKDLASDDPKIQRQAVSTIVHEVGHSSNTTPIQRDILKERMASYTKHSEKDQEAAEAVINKNLTYVITEGPNDMLSQHHVARKYDPDIKPKTREELSKVGKWSTSEDMEKAGVGYLGFMEHFAHWALTENNDNPKEARKFLAKMHQAKNDEAGKDFMNENLAKFGWYAMINETNGGRIVEKTGDAATFSQADRNIQLMSALQQGMGHGEDSVDYDDLSDSYDKMLEPDYARKDIIGGTPEDVQWLLYGEPEGETGMKKSLRKEDGGGFDGGAGTVFTSTDTGVFTTTYGGSSAKHRTQVKKKKKKKKTGIERLGSWLTDYSPERKSMQKATPTDFAVDLLYSISKEYKIKDRKLRNKVDTKYPNNESVTNYRPKILDWKKNDYDNAGALQYAKAIDTESSDEVGKITQEQAGFRKATPFENSQKVQCGSCIFFSEDDNECHLVTGYIEEDTWCNLFSSENKPQPDENEMVEGEDIEKARDLEDYFSNKYPMQSDKLKRRIIREGVFPRECAGCKCAEWKGSVVPLELDHIDGDHGNNAKENLQLICPNCHALTPHYRVKKPGSKSAIDLHGGAPKGDPRRDKSLDKELRKAASKEKNPAEWGTPTLHHTDVLNRKYQVLTKKPEAYLDSLSAPPDNEMEISAIKHYQEDASRVSKEIHEQDKDLAKPFFDYLKENKLEIDEDYIHAVNKDVNTIVHHAKFKFNRPRPAQVSEIKPTPNEGGYSPAYPSGHATQATVIAGILSKIYPEHSEDFNKIASKIGVNRIRAGLHYPSDNRAGQALGMEILEDMPPIDTEQHLEKAEQVIEGKPRKDSPNTVLEQNEFMDRLKATTAKHVGDKKDDSDVKASTMAADAPFGPEIRLSAELENQYKNDIEFRKMVNLIRKKK